jgi:hypothetical protein
MAGRPENPAAKVSPALAALLADLPPTEVVRVVLLLDVPPPGPGRPITTGNRAKAVADTRAATAHLLDQLRPTLSAVGARQADNGGLAPLGGVVIDVPAGGISRVADADQVRAILPDQRLIRPDVR